MPLLFLGHGSPMNAIEENEFVTGFRNISKTLPQPSAVLCISAHWFVRGTHFTVQEKPPTIHDFYGFPEELSHFQYPANGSPVLAKDAKELVRSAFSALDDQWGLDHGAWSVLTHLFPKADVPVVQMSIDYTKDAEYHFELASRLSALRDRGVLILGSGNIIHNLRMLDFQRINGPEYGYDWALETRESINQLMLEGDYSSLLDYEKLGKSMQLSVPTPEHYLPLIYILGLKRKEETIRLFNDKLVGGSISMTSAIIERT